MSYIPGGARVWVSLLVLCTAGSAQAGWLRDTVEARRADADKVQDVAISNVGGAGYIPLQSGGFKRQYILYAPSIPTAADPAASQPSSKPIPLVVVLHGTVGTGEKMQKSLGFDPYARRHGFAVAYPDAYTNDNGKNTTRWNDGRDTLESTKLGVDDVAFIRDMVNDIGKRIPLDRSRVYVTGASNGGIMAYRLICEASDLFAGAAPVIGNIAVSVAPHCAPRHPMSVLAINGTQDPFVPFEGGTVCKDVSKLFCEKGEVISAENSLALLAKNFGCGAKSLRVMQPAKFPEDPPVESVIYGRCANDSKVVGYWIQGGGHTWPPHKGQLDDKNGKPTRNLDATKAIVDFFMTGKL